MQFLHASSITLMEKKERQYLVNPGIVKVLKKPISVRSKNVEGEPDE